jgi:hypothetical protein
MKQEEHLKADRERFGREFPEVHEALDYAFAVRGLAHRKERHHLDFVLSQGWNVEQVRSAIFHIIDDCDGRLMIETDWAHSDVFLGREKA